MLTPSNSRQNWPETAERLLKSFCHENKFYNYRSKPTAHNELMDDVLFQLAARFNPQEWNRDAASHRTKLKDKIKSKLPRTRDEDRHKAAVVKVQEILDIVSPICYNDILRVVIQKTGEALVSNVLAAMRQPEH